MSKGTYTPPKPPTAKQMKKIITTFEKSFNDIVETTKLFEPESVAGIEARWVRDHAFTLHGSLRALHDFVADEEVDAKQRLSGATSVSVGHLLAAKEQSA